ncbi:hypothetical protein DPEC_G00228240 [Dallia pectoralis]|uniref:Uncharacterized protein n=1 Tax=Dallia pectoralis TaxID=75939 RepID=A0ACC2G1G0_DALPE|nr:hypothetical protein DPEC_G00228240 [Dallia pectoralis]
MGQSLLLTPKRVSEKPRIISLPPYGLSPRRRVNCDFVAAAIQHDSTAKSSSIWEGANHDMRPELVSMETTLE